MVWEGALLMAIQKQPAKRSARTAGTRKTTTLATRHTSTDALDQWAVRIVGAMNKTVDGIFETGRLLFECREKVQHGDWERLFSDGKVPMSVQTALKLIAVHKRRGLLTSNPAHVRGLPPSWGTLYELAALPEDTLAWAHEHEKIRPDMQRKDVAAIKREFGGDETKEPEKPWELIDARERIYRWLLRDREHWPDALRDDYCEVLSKLIEKLRHETISH